MLSLWHSCTCGKCKCTHDPIFVTKKENGRKLTIFNQDESHICIIKLDGCVYPKGNTDSKCDYIFMLQPKNDKSSSPSKVLFVELKGRNIDDAVEQLETTIQRFTSDFRNITKDAMVVGKGCPSAYTSTFRRKKIYFEQKLKTNLLLKNGECEINHSFT